MALTPWFLGALIVSGSLGTQAVPPQAEPIASAGAARAAAVQIAAETATPSLAAVSVIAAGLTNPRGFDFAPDGSLAVALAGASGATAAVASVVGGCPAPLVEGLPSYRIVFAAPTGVADVAYLDGALYLLLAGGNIDGDGMANGLYRLDGDGETTLVADVSAFIRDNPVAEVPDDYDTDGQPYALLPMGDAFWVTEGNSNQLLRLGLDGAVSRVADLSVGHPIPTGIAPAPGGGAYLGFFTNIPYREGAAVVVRVSADGTVTEAWSGLTLITALAVGPDDALYALEMATGIDPEDPDSIAPGSGRVVRLGEGGAIEEVVTGLALPVSMAFGPDRALYVGGPTFGADQGQGTIVRIDLAAGEPVAMPAEMPAGPPC